MSRRFLHAIFPAEDESGMSFKNPECGRPSQLLGRGSGVCFLLSGRGAVSAASPLATISFMR